MKKSLIIAMACYGLSATAQVQESKNFLYLYSDSVIYADRILMRMDLSDRLHIQADSRRISSEQVKFINNEDGFFGKIRKRRTGENLLAEKVIEGRINIFKSVSFDDLYYDQYHDKTGYRHLSVYRSRYTSAQSVTGDIYYNKGYGDLKKISYSNLKNDMTNDKECLDLLEGYRKSLRTTKILYIAGGASLLAAVIVGVVNVNRMGNTQADVMLFGISGGFALGGGLKQLSTDKKLEAAIDHYNR